MILKNSIAYLGRGLLGLFSADDAQLVDKGAQYGHTVSNLGVLRATCELQAQLSSHLLGCARQPLAEQPIEMGSVQRHEHCLPVAHGRRVVRVQLQQQLQVTCVKACLILLSVHRHSLRKVV